jgi:hypothetical protein
MPAPWVPYTRAGCDFGAVSFANIVLENTGTGPNGDMTKVFGSGSAEWNEADASNKAPANTAARALAQTDFVGIALHCARESAICATPNAKPDLLPDEPEGYNGFLGLFGAKYVNPAITGGGVLLNDLDSNPIVDPFDQPGFPGFDGMFPTVTLSYIATMQEQGIPVTFGYISDAHDEHGAAGETHIADGPGQAECGPLRPRRCIRKVFKRLEAAGITKKHTVHLTVEEGDHFVGSQATPTAATAYARRSQSCREINGKPVSHAANYHPFTVHFQTWRRLFTSPAIPGERTRSRGIWSCAEQTHYHYTGQTDELTAAPDPVAICCMITADPQRTPTLTMFAHPDYFYRCGRLRAPL